MGRGLASWEGYLLAIIKAVASAATYKQCGVLKEGAGTAVIVGQPYIHYAKKPISTQ